MGHYNEAIKDYMRRNMEQLRRQSVFQILSDQVFHNDVFILLVFLWNMRIIARIGERAWRLGSHWKVHAVAQACWPTPHWTQGLLTGARFLTSYVGWRSWPAKDINGMRVLTLGSSVTVKIRWQGPERAKISRVWYGGTWKLWREWQLCLWSKKEG